MNIYFSGIGGVGLGPLAEISLDAGYDVAGSDIEPTESLMSKQLRSKGVVIGDDQSGKYLQECHSKKPIDWYIYTTAVFTGPGKAELEMAQQLGIRVAKRDELLSYIIQDKNLKLIAASGTHGKTTTTGMLIWAFQNLNIPISYSVGTTISFGPSGKFDPTSEYFIYECDEFDKNFLNFYPYLALIPSIDHDHADTYPDQEEYFEAFHQFASQCQHVYSWRDQNGEIFAGLPQVELLDPKIAEDTRTLRGAHNRRNATLVKKGLQYLGINDDLDDIMSSFPGVGRRFEKLADNLYTDYGHHPIEVAATLQMAREISDHVVLVYQPHQNLRQHHILSRDQYTNQFELAEKVYWLPTYLTREDPSLKVLEPDELIKTITNKQDIVISDFDDRLWQSIQQARSEGKLVLCEGAGRIDGWIREKLTETTN